MISDEKYAQGAARLLREQLPPAEVARPPVDRDRLVAAMELALAQQIRRRRAMRMGGWAVAAAAGLLLVLKLTHSDAQPLLVERIAGQGNTLVRQGQAQVLVAATSLLEGDEIRSGEAGGATLGLGRGTTVALASASQVRVIEASPARRLLLSRGQVDASVAKLRPNERLVVATPDSEVEVRGTRFTVKVADAPAGCGGPHQRSSVEVQDGTVWVRSQGEERVLTTGQMFARPCAKSSNVEPLPEATAPAASPPEERRPSTVSIPRRRSASTVAAKISAKESETVAAEPASQLAEQNDLLSSAMAAARAGQNDLALRRLDALLARFPEGPLSETARIERQRIKSAQTIQH